jgi:hypothetical protein
MAILNALIKYIRATEVALIVEAKVMFVTYLPDLAIFASNSTAKSKAPM